jgi:hypothetical protein
MPSPQELKTWLNDIYEKFGDNVIPPDKIDKVITQIQKHLGTKLGKVIGTGANGIVFVADDGDIVKFTLDAKEALLWARLKNKQVPGIVGLKDVLHIVNKNSQDNYLYVLKADYAPKPLSPTQATKVRQILNQAKPELEKLATRARLANRADQYKADRTGHYVNAFQDLAETDPEFSEIPELLMDLADKYGGYIYDLQPDNFRTRLDDTVVLVDPSVPDLVGNYDGPEELFFEEKVEISLRITKYYI